MPPRPARPSSRAATRRFTTEGYQHAGAREIAADAGVTAALVNRYFGSKEGLFAEVIDRALDIGHLLQGQRGSLAGHLARVMVCGREDSQAPGYTTLLLLLHSATEPHAVKLFRRDLNCAALPLLAERIGGDDSAVRAVMVMAQLRGSRSCTTCIAQRHSRTPVTRNWWCFCPGAWPPVSAQTHDNRYDW